MRMTLPSVLVLALVAATSVLAARDQAPASPQAPAAPAAPRVPAAPRTPGQALQADDPSTWPQQLALDGAAVYIYQPQPEALNGDRLTGRAAFSWQDADAKEPSFGALWFDARIETDRDADSALIDDFRITRVRVTGVDEAKERGITSALQRATSQARFETALSTLTSSLASAKDAKVQADGIRHDAPRIVIANQKSVLVTIDGAPKREKLKDSTLERVVNTPFFIVYDPSTRKHYLHGEQAWYAATEATGPYAVVGAPSPAVAQVWSAVVAAATKAGDTPGEGASQGDGPPPAIVVATEPTELIATDGRAEMVAIPGTTLQYVKNTPSDVFFDTATRKVYVLLSGRWYSTMDVSQGPWTFVESSALPADFAKVPADSDKALVRASVTGTDEARDAVLDSFVPQTAKVDPKTAKADVTWDGKPQFKKIDNTEISYSTNSSTPVFLIDGVFYACADGVWYQAAGPEGPWGVSTRTPPRLEQVPPSNPYYNTRYVQVYSATPEVVYVGYTPGYMGAYPWGGTIVYGTGFYYPPYYGGWYRPYPATWGFGASYNPWTGWGFSVGFGGPNGWLAVGTGGASFGFGVGPMAVGWYPRPYYGGVGWFGGGYYRPSWNSVHVNNININNYYRPGWNGGGIYNRPGYNRPGVRPGYNGGYNRPGYTRPGYGNGYNRPATRPVTRPGGAYGSGYTRDRRPNDVYAGADGSVHRPGINGWETRDTSGWQRPAPGAGANTRDLDRDQMARQRGTNRTAPSSMGASPRTRPSGGASRPTPRSGGGGGGRRR